MRIQYKPSDSKIIALHFIISSYRTVTLRISTAHISIIYHLEWPRSEVIWGLQGLSKSVLTDRGHSIILIATISILYQ
jgi:hypothetical protein